MAKILYASIKLSAVQKRLLHARTRLKWAWQVFSARFARPTCLSTPIAKILGSLLNHVVTSVLWYMYMF